MQSTSIKPVKSNALRAALSKLASCIFGSLKTVNGHSLVGEGWIIVSPRGAAAIEIEDVESDEGTLFVFKKQFSYSLVFDSSSRRICLKAVNKSTKTAAHYSAWPGMDAVCDSSGRPWDDVVFVADGKLWLWDGTDLNPYETSGGGSGVEISRLGGLAFDPVSGKLGVAFDGSTIKVNPSSGSLFVPAASASAAGLLSSQDKSKLDSLEATYASKTTVDDIETKVTAMTPRPVTFDMSSISVVKAHDPVSKEEPGRWNTVPPDFDISIADVVGFENLVNLNATEFVFNSSSDHFALHVRVAGLYISSGMPTYRLQPISDSLGRIYFGTITVPEHSPMSVRWQSAPYTYAPA